MINKATLEKVKKIGETFLIVLAVFSAISTGGTFAFKSIYHKEINDFNDARTYMKLAKDSLIPSSNRRHGQASHRLDMLEKKHSGGFAVGLRWDEVEEKMIFRHPDGKRYDAFQRPGSIEWRYTKEGVDYYVYN
jgi:hypothetical protein